MKIINYAKSLLWGIGIIFVLSLLTTIFHYFNILSTNGLQIVTMIVPILALIFSSFYLGRRSKEKGWLEGLKLGGSYLVIITLLAFLIFRHEFQIKILLYDTIILLSTMFGSMLGINFKK